MRANATGDSSHLVSLTRLMPATAAMLILQCRQSQQLSYVEKLTIHHGQSSRQSQKPEPYVRQSARALDTTHR